MFVHFLWRQITSTRLVMQIAKLVVSRSVRRRASISRILEEKIATVTADHNTIKGKTAGLVAGLQR